MTVCAARSMHGASAEGREATWRFFTGNFDRLVVPYPPRPHTRTRMHARALAPYVSLALSFAPLQFARNSTLNGLIVCKCTAPVARPVTVTLTITVSSLGGPQTLSETRRHTHTTTVRHRIHGRLSHVRTHVKRSHAQPHKRHDDDDMRSPQWRLTSFAWVGTGL